jgi:hypothetical protein
MPSRLISEVAWPYPVIMETSVEKMIQQAIMIELDNRNIEVHTSKQEADLRISCEIRSFKYYRKLSESRLTITIHCKIMDNNTNKLILDKEVNKCLTKKYRTNADMEIASRGMRSHPPHEYILIYPQNYIIDIIAILLFFSRNGPHHLKREHSHIADMIDQGLSATIPSFFKNL